MSTITPDATNINPDALAAAAAAIASVLNLGDQVTAGSEWPDATEDVTISFSVGGDAAGWLSLSVGEAIAERISSDSDSLQAGFRQALDQLGDQSGLTLTLGEMEPAGAVPTHIVEIRDDTGSCTVLGVALTGAPAADSEAGDHDGPAVYEPAALAANGQALTTPSSGPLSLLHDVDMEVTVELGRTTMPIRELLALQPGMVVEIDRTAGTPIDVLVNGRLIACGEVVVFDEEFGVRITEIVDSGARL